MSKASTLRLDIVSAEKEIFSGEASMVFATGEQGELGIAPGHSQLLTTLKPGYVRVMMLGEGEEIFYVNGGMLEVQPFVVSILADTAIRADEIDEEAALSVKTRAMQTLSGKSSAIDMAKAMLELAEAAAQIQAIHKLKSRARVG